MLSVIVEPSSYLYLLAGLQSKSQWFRFELLKLGLFFDEVYCFGYTKNGLLETKPLGSFLDIGDEALGMLPNYSPPTEEQLQDLRMALGDKPDDEGGDYAYLLMRSLLDIARKKHCYFYTFPGHRDGFINFCLKHQPECLPIIKESFLLCNIIEFIFEQEIPAFDPIESEKLIGGFAEYKTDFQKGILSFLEKFKDGYALSDDQRRYIQEKTAGEERRLLDFLKPENLRKYNISKLDVAGDVIGGGVSLIIPIPLPIGTLLSLGREIKQVEDFKKADLDFILSLTTLKKITNVGKPEEAPYCVVCNLSPSEIEEMTEDECVKILYGKELCVKHMVGRLDLRKRFRLWGKDLLREMKRLGDSSVFIDV
jgi:hypothetical protein